MATLFIHAVIETQTKLEALHGLVTAFKMPKELGAAIGEASTRCKQLEDSIRRDSRLEAQLNIDEFKSYAQEALIITVNLGEPTIGNLLDRIFNEMNNDI
ncbi:hypothetical protein NVP1215B_046 [Vibrio phage 1.215.B._10N.222.54.F7]|nr:hypothetical protein NVP1215A_046 [Vibrio phage 1.215.A._10N.222.54.F7]AUR96069.1 hypothetical protein NVP1215B_046 [Vibrio phage 1.215.B._10N.222.54.F7]